MIIQLRGTSGSGKSTIVKHVMQRFPRIVKLHREGRRQPIGYLCGDDKGLRLQIIGHYETACGGCDTITSLDDVYQQVTQAATFGYDVLYEGIMASGEYKRCVELHRAGLDLLVIGLDVPIEDCLRGVQARRDLRGESKPLDPARTIRRAGEVKRMMQHCKNAGLNVEWKSRNDALQRCLEVFSCNNGHMAEAIGPVSA